MRPYRKLLPCFQPPQPDLPRKVERSRRRQGFLSCRLGPRNHSDLLFPLCVACLVPQTQLNLAKTSTEKDPLVSWPKRRRLDRSVTGQFPIGEPQISWQRVVLPTA